MKQDIHPDYHEIIVKMTNGSTFKTRSTYGKKGDTLQLDIDINTHPAWTGGTAVLNKKAGRVADFNKKFGNISFSTKKQAASANNAESESEK
ncbi:MAG: 50S ribosomal protein L31 [Alphaproteobacteria bacterium CG11_big_fil_rev_8_21_14_0_20_39_49]|nr:MAG: 50S ribosomal protein L31 [Alphaproteobacteria bacterium CG11_big_fil_rev_8_21_14_0_20_39_49]